MFYNCEVCMKKIKHLMNIEYCLEKQKCRTIKTIMIDKKGKQLIKNLYIFRYQTIKKFL